MNARTLLTLLADAGYCVARDDHRPLTDYDHRAVAALLTGVLTDARGEYAMTDAEKIADHFGNDGARFWSGDIAGEGTELLDALGEAGAREYRARDGDSVRHELPDQSAIIITDGAWDLGITGTDYDRHDCVCWSEDGETCRYPHECECPCHGTEDADGGPPYDAATATDMYD